MGSETIELYMPWTPKKVQWPVAVQQKFDGVPVRFINVGGNVVGYSRQGEQFLCLGHLEEVVKYLLLELGSSCVGELYVPGKPFKEISGLARQTKKQSPELQLYVFDFDIMASGTEHWRIRHSQLNTALGTYLHAKGQTAMQCPVKLIPSRVCHNQAAVDEAVAVIYAAFPGAEGAVAHSLLKPFQPGKRVWTTQKIKKRPTLDLRITGVYEAVSGKDGSGLGMVGRMEAEYTRLGADGKPITTTIGVGPGALSHSERRALWAGRVILRNTKPVAEVEYMIDPTYNALRQAVFVRWRPEKSEGEVHV